jgi:hypothetical protein
VPFLGRSRYAGLPYRFAHARTGLYLTDITFCREGNSDYRASPPNRPLINFNKYHKLAKIVQGNMALFFSRFGQSVNSFVWYADMQRFQVSYNLKEIPEVQQYLTAQFDQAKNAGDLHDLYRRRCVSVCKVCFFNPNSSCSLLVEPRRPADASISPTDGKQPLFQIWGLGTLSRSQGTMFASKNAS